MSQWASAIPIGSIRSVILEIVRNMIIYPRKMRARVTLASLLLSFGQTNLTRRNAILS